MPSNQLIAQLYLTHAGDLLSFLRGKLHCQETARELTHETFARLLTSPGQKPIRNARALLFRIAGNLAIDHYRAHGRVQHTDLDACEPLPCPRPGPEQIAIARQQLEQVVRAIENLPRQCRRVFIAFKIDGQSQRDIAGELGVSLNAVEKQLIRAMVQLRQHLY